MISIIVCSVNQQLFHQLSVNIEQTIGTPYELIRIDNEKNKLGICDAYNMGTAKTIHPILCFIHEDIRFETSDWGNKLLQCYEDAEIGLVGVAGSCYYSLPPVGWFNLNEIECNYIQEYQDGRQAEHRRLSRFPGPTEHEVVVIDGIFISCRRSLAEKYAFDSKNFPGFHGYDIDFSLQLEKIAKKIITEEILIRHFSEGKLDRSWYNAIVRVSKKWGSLLPASVNTYSEKELKTLEMESLEVFFYFSSKYFSRLKRTRLYFYYALKLGRFREATAYFITRIKGKFRKGK